MHARTRHKLERLHSDAGVVLSRPLHRRSSRGSCWRPSLGPLACRWGAGVVIENGGAVRDTWKWIPSTGGMSRWGGARFTAFRLSGSISNPVISSEVAKWLLRSRNMKPLLVGGRYPGGRLVPLKRTLSRDSEPLFKVAFLSLFLVLVSRSRKEKRESSGSARSAKLDPPLPHVASPGQVPWAVTFVVSFPTPPVRCLVLNAIQVLFHCSVMRFVS